MSANASLLDSTTAAADQAGLSDDGKIELSVVMPCLNEERTLPICIGKALRTMDELSVVGEVLIVDNGSTDNSVQVAEQAGARVVQESRKGYGNALRRGFAEARGRYIIMGDCDDSYDFTDLERFLVRLRDGADLVMGNRLAGEIKRGAMPLHHRYFGNPVLSRFLNVLFRTGVGDSHCGMRGFTKEAFRRMNLHMPGMELASEMVIKSAKAGLRIEEIPITLWPDGRDRAPHLRSFRDGWRHLRFMLMCSPSFLFVYPGMLLTLLGLIAIPLVVLLGYGTYDGRYGPNFMYATSVVSVAGTQLVLFGVLAKVFTHLVEPVFEDPRVDWFLSWFTVERGILAGLALFATGAGLGGYVGVAWWRTNQVALPSLLIFAGTMLTIGIEVVFSSFLIGLMDLPREAGRDG